ncbi:MAG: hypothetical protein Q4A33_00360 [Candidatus Saccharibacteria bacterium]|nr:hypothetical protein [Candidatus Saccharibacteria bacterium]
MEKDFAVYHTEEGKISRRLSDFFGLVANRMVYQHRREDRMVIWVDIEPCNFSFGLINPKEAYEDFDESKICRLIYATHKEDSSSEAIAKLIKKAYPYEDEGYEPQRLAIAEYTSKRMNGGPSGGPGMMLTQFRQYYRVKIHLRRYAPLCPERPGRDGWIIYNLTSSMELLKLCIEKDSPQFRNLIVQFIEEKNVN